MNMFIEFNKELEEYNKNMTAALFPVFAGEVQENKDPVEEYKYEDWEPL